MSYRIDETSVSTASLRPRLCQGLGSCVCASGWHHTVACWEGLLHPHGIYNIYSPPEQMSSLSHSVWLASLHTGAPTKQKVAEKLLRQSVPHPLAQFFSFPPVVSIRPLEVDQHGKLITANDFPLFIFFYCRHKVNKFRNNECLKICGKTNTLRQIASVLAAKMRCHGMSHKESELCFMRD